MTNLYDSNDFTVTGIRIALDEIFPVSNYGALAAYLDHQQHFAA